MRASRLLTILMTLQLRGRVTAQALAELLEVSRRTIYRDIDELSAAGVPVYAERGPDGGFALLDGFRLQLTGLTTAETEALSLAGVPAAAADLGLSRAASDARLKLLAALPEAGRAGAERVAERFHLDPVDWYRRHRVPPQLATVAEALWSDRRLAVSYESWAGASRRRIEPLGLVLKAGRWYLVARAGRKDGIYRLDKILDACVTDERFERPPGFELAAAWQAAVASFEASLRRGTATLRASPSSLDRLERLGADMAEPLLAATPDAQGWREATVPIEGVAHAAALLLGFADEIEVRAPAELRDELARRARRVVGLYSR
jgi:predicted DNA-binding transcriptional regulator YafY